MSIAFKQKIFGFQSIILGPGLESETPELFSENYLPIATFHLSMLSCDQYRK